MLRRKNRKKIRNTTLLIGEPGAGKTAYFSAFYYLISHKPREVSKFLRDGRFLLIPQVNSGIKQLTNMVSSFIDKGVFPSRTRAVGVLTEKQIEDMLIDLSLYIEDKELNNKYEMSFQLFDFPGEFFWDQVRRRALSITGFDTLLDRLSPVEEKAVKLYLDLLKNAKGLVFIINPFQDLTRKSSHGEGQDFLLSLFFSQFVKKEMKNLERIAAVIMKSDMLPTIDVPPETFLKKTMPLTMAALKTDFEGQLKYFYASASGGIRGYKELVNEDGTKTKHPLPFHPPKPYGVLESALWVMGLEKIEKVTKKIKKV